MVHISDIQNEEFREINRVANRLRKEIEKVKESIGGKRSYKTMCKALEEWTVDLMARFPHGSLLPKTQLRMYYSEYPFLLGSRDAASEEEYDVTLMSLDIYFHVDGFEPEYKEGKYDSGWSEPHYMGKINFYGAVKRGPMKQRANHYSDFKPGNLTCELRLYVDRGERWKSVSRVAKKHEETKLDNEKHDYKITFYKKQMFEVWVKARTKEEARDVFRAGLVEIPERPVGELELIDGYTSYHWSYECPQKEALQMMIEGQDMTR